MSAYDIKLGRVDDKLIQAVYKHPNLYNCTIKEYKDKDQRAAAWAAVIAELPCETNVEECEFRWNYLRGAFAQSRKARKLPEGAPGSRKRSFKYYEMMRFLDPFVKERQRQRASARFDDYDPLLPTDNSSSAIQVVSAEEEPAISPASSFDPWIPPPFKKTCPTEVFDTLFHQQLRTQQLEEEEFAAYAKSVAANIKRLNPQQRQLAKLRIEQVLYDVEFGPLKAESSHAFGSS